MYGLTDEEKRRKEELERKEVEKLPWHIPINYWERWELDILSKHNLRQGLRDLDEVEKKIKEGKDGE
ncbi:MAG: hypothetical protein ABW072_11750 [Sedimenticola sp.]